MFPSRVLPPPQLLADNFSAGVAFSSPPVKPDALREHRIIMTGEEREKDSQPLLSSSDRPHSPEPRRESATTAEKQSSIDNKQSVITEASTVSVPPSTRKKRQISQVHEPAPRDRGLSAISTKPIGSPSQICLCQPDPKVPRPRNAFILYRQHHQAKVVTEHPGLANPEISKIIGDQWRNSADQVKAHWKSLAEEEKLRHQRQYPDYRYQPKRGRNSIAAASISVPGAPSPRCPKCGGKSMATPTNTTAPSPNFRPPPPESPVSSKIIPNSHPNPHAQTPNNAMDQAYAHAHNQHLYYPPQSAIIPRTPYGLPTSAYNMAMSPIHPSFSMHRPMPMTSGLRAMDPRSPAGMGPGADYPMSPDAKRRRYDTLPGTGRYADNGHARMMSRQGMPPTISHQQQQQQHHAMNAPLNSADRLRHSQQSPGSTIAPAPPGSRSMSISNGQASGPPQTPCGLRQDRNLTLAPLKIKSPNTLLSQSQIQAQTQSVEAMVLSIRPLHKLRTLQRISLPIPAPAPPLATTSSAQPTCGALIAIEYGTDRAAGELVANAIRDDLVRGNEFVTRAFDSPVLECYGNGAGGVEGGGLVNSDVLKLMDCWHGVSREIEKYITRGPVGVEDEDGDGAKSPVSPRTKTRTMETRAGVKKRKVREDVDEGYDEDGEGEGEGDEEGSVDEAAESLVRAAEQTPGVLTKPKAPIPIALVPNYQLTATDRAACAVPISDEYSPLDHWRWVAALWRGTVGPDVTIAIRGPNEADGVNSPVAPLPNGSVLGQSGNGAAAAGAKGKAAVEVLLEECRTVVVRVEKTGEVGESAVRRVAFEVGEWLRGRERRERGE